MEQYGKEAESKAKEAKAELEKQANKTGRDLQGAVDKFDKNVEEVSFVLLFSCLLDLSARWGVYVSYLIEARCCWGRMPGWQSEVMQISGGN